MKDLILPVKGIYFDQIKDGSKLFEYRLVTPYWVKRIEGKTYRNVIVTRGYPKRDDAERRIVFPWILPEIVKLTHPHFGDKEVTVYAIKVSK